MNRVEMVVTIAGTDSKTGGDVINASATYGSFKSWLRIGYVVPESKFLGQELLKDMMNDQGKKS